jgi:hypothetical protein
VTLKVTMHRAPDFLDLIGRQMFEPNEQVLRGA